MNRVVAAVALCAILAASASAITIDMSYDGTYDPGALPPPPGQSMWTVITAGSGAVVPNSPSAGVATFLDASSSDQVSMYNSLSTYLDPATLGYVPDVFGAEWEYSIRMACTSPGYPRVFFGLRDEGVKYGRNVLFAHSSTGVNLFYVVDTGGTQMTPDLYTADETHPTLGDGAMHDYRMVKRANGSVMLMDFYLDGTLLDTRPYANFTSITSSFTNGVGIWTSKTGVSDYVIDSVHFAMTVPEPVVPTTEHQVSDVFRYNGSYAPDSATPPPGQTTWKLIATGSLTPATAFQPNTPTAGLMKLLDNDTAGRAAMSHAITDAAFIASPDEYEWEYRFTMAFNSWTGDATRFPYFGLRDEGGSGRSACFSHSATGDLFYAPAVGPAPAATEYLYTAGVDGPALNDGQMHTYRVVKDVKPGVGIDVLFYLDNVLIDTRDYYSLDPDDTDRYPVADYGFGVFTSTPATLDYVIDEMYFGTSAPVHVPGDADGNGKVNEIDAQALAANWGTTSDATWAMGDFNGDHAVDAADASILAANWGFGVTEGNAVPEPGFAVLALGAMALLACFRGWARRRDRE